MKYYITQEGLGYIEEVKTAKQHGKEAEEREFEKGVYGFQSDLTGTLKGAEAQMTRKRRLRKTRLHRWGRALARITDPFSNAGRKVQEAKKKKRGDDRDEEGGRGDNGGDEALEGLFTQKRLKFLQRKK